MPEVDGQHVVCKLLDLLYDKSLATLSPADYVLVFFVLSHINRTSKI